MRILCVIMVGAFLLSIAIADNGNSLRPSPPDFTGQLPQPSSINHGLLPQASSINHGLLPQPHSTNIPNPWSSVQPKTTNVPWTPQHRAVQNNPIYNQPSNDLTLQDNIASPAVLSTQYANAPPNTLDLQHQPKSLSSLLPFDNKIMILEPLPKPKVPSWTDWMPDFFLDDSGEKGPGPLIGPIDMPGMGSQVYIRQNEPPPDDVDHVVIHVVNRIGDSLFTPPSLPTQLQLAVPPPQQQELVSYYTKDPALRPDSFATSGSETSNVLNGSPWKLQPNLPDIAIHDKKFQHSTPDGVLEMPNEETKPKLTVMLLKQAGSKPPSVVWSRPVDRQGYGRSFNPLDSQEPVTFPENSQTDPSSTSQNTSYSDVPEFRAPSRAVRYTGPPIYGHQNGTRAPGESAHAATAAVVHLPQRSNRAHDEILRFKPNYADGISAQNRRQVPSPTADRISLTDAAYPEAQPLRSPRNRYSGTNHFARANVVHQRPAVTTTVAPEPPSVPSTATLPTRQTAPSRSYEDGGLRIVPAPNLAPGSAETSTRGRARSRTNSSEEVVQNIMSMTASQTWKNITSRSPKANEANKDTQLETKKDARAALKKTSRGEAKYNYRVEPRNSTQAEPKNNTQVESKNNTRTAAKNNTRVETKNNTQAQSRNRPRAEARISTQEEYRNNTKAEKKNSALPVIKNNTQTETKNNTRSGRKIIGVEVKKSTSVEIKKSTSPEVKRIVRYDVKNSSNAETKKNNSEVRNTTDQVKTNSNSESKKNVSSVVKKDVSSQAKKDNTTELKKSATNKPTIMQRRIDYERELIMDVETKDMPRAEAITAPNINKIIKAETKMREAIQKIMSSFSQWRHKPVTTDFINELDEKKKKRNKN